jgi:hypothetical protein
VCGWLSDRVTSVPRGGSILLSSKWKEDEEYFFGSGTMAGYVRNNDTAMWDDSMEMHYSDYLWSDNDFVEYAKLSVYTENERQFKGLAMIRTEENEQKLDRACQLLFGELRKSTTQLGNPTACCGSSFMVQVYLLQIDDCRLMRVANKLRSIVCDAEGSSSGTCHRYVAYLSPLLPSCSSGSSSSM